MMIIDKIKNCDLYYKSKALKQAFDFLKTLDYSSKNNRYEVGNGIYAVVECYSTKSVKEGRLEAHRKYIDIQTVLAGKEKIGWHNISGLTEETPYDNENDIVFYKLPKNTEVNSFTVISPGSFMLLYPQDGHMPQIHPENKLEQVKKAVIKIPV